MAFETEELWFDEWDHGGPWWERTDPEKWNPVNHVAKWKTPMLVITGEKDFRIPYSQGLAAFTALQRRGFPSQLLVFPAERSAEHTSAPPSLIRLSYAVFCLQKTYNKITY